MEPVLGRGIVDFEMTKKTANPCYLLALRSDNIPEFKSHHDGKQKVTRISNGDGHGGGDEQRCPLSGKATIKH